MKISNKTLNLFSPSTISYKRPFFLWTAILLGIAININNTLAQDSVTLTNEDHESPPIRAASEFFSKDKLNGAHYGVDPRVLNNGYNNIYNLSADYGFFKVHSTAELKIRIQEVKAITALDGLSKSDQFKEALKKSAKTPYYGVKRLVTNPVDTITGIPKGLWSFGSRTKSLISEDRSQMEDNRLKEFIGFSKAKRQYAHRLGVDVYSTNKPLQDRLDKISWTAFSGALGPNIVFSQIKGAAGLAVTASKMTENLNKMILVNSPEDLRKINRDKLKGFGVDQSLIDAYTGHDWLSPRHQTAIVLALEKMVGVGGRVDVIKAAEKCEDERQSYLIQKMMEMTHDYHLLKPLTQLYTWRRLIGGIDGNNQLVLTLPVDFIYWTELVDITFNGIDEDIKSRDVTVKILRITGNVSEKAFKRLIDRGWRIETHILDQVASN